MYGLERAEILLASYCACVIVDRADGTPEIAIADGPASFAGTRLKSGAQKANERCGIKDRLDRNWRRRLLYRVSETRAELGRGFSGCNAFRVDALPARALRRISDSKASRFRRDLQVMQKKIG